MAAMPHAPTPPAGVITVLEDAIHCEQARFSTFDEALAELNRRAGLRWDEPPNRAPCTSWATCGREYHLLEYDVSVRPGKLFRSVHALDVSPKGVAWAANFPDAWRGAETQ